MNRWATLATAGAAALTSVLAYSSTAQAADGTCEIQEACYYFNSNTSGSMIDYEGDQWTHHDDYFISSGNGQGQVVGNNAASLFCNMGPLFTCETWFNSGYGGDSFKTLGTKRVNLPLWLKNNNASSKKYYSGGCSGPGC
ncbi:hypothetical protein RKD23_004547 [Streptomyces sp. SAI-170]|uniref:hypothetical protein n=1 Tax=Streptomyces sp. SAI-170 TaxID=3377729 RepID=UPI003C7971D4